MNVKTVKLVVEREELGPTFGGDGHETLTNDEIETPPARIGDVWVMQDEEFGTPVGPSRRMSVQKIRKLANGGWELTFNETE